ncbi:MAG: hypothetical protein HY903_22265 [Deltaproteobacteria bacterium]|nr:hypothetical protein [Deltaproteobacteria bacterium]
MMRLRLLWLLCCPLSACGETPVLELRGVEPPRGLVSVATQVTLLGRFPLDVSVSYQDESRSEVNADYAVHIGGRAAASVTWAEVTALIAVVPAGLALGAHDVEVGAPDGRSVALPAGFTAVDVLR